MPDPESRLLVVALVLVVILAGSAAVLWRGAARQRDLLRAEKAQSLWPPATPIAPGTPDAARAWEHALHEERVLNDRSNLFLVAEAMLLVFYATLRPEPAIGVILALLGLALTLLWWMLTVRQFADLTLALARLQQASPDYVEYRKARDRLAGFRWADRAILGSAVPLVVTCVWLVLLITAAA